MIKFLNLNSEKPYIHFQSLYQKALENGQKGVEARYVNLKYIDNNEWIFFSNYLSPKANQFESHSQVSVLIYWASINTQIRMKAKIFKTSSESFDAVAKNFYETLEFMNAETPRPDFWGGYSFIPYYFEFWQGHENRLNKRHIFKQQDDAWVEQFLQP